MLRQALSHPNEGRPPWSGVVPFALAVTVGEIEGQRAWVGIDDDLGLAESTGRLFGESEQNAAVALPLEIAADADEAKTCRLLADRIDGPRTQELGVVGRARGRMVWREFVRAALVIGLGR